MKPNPSITSRATVRSLVVACMPATALAFAANSPLLGAALSDSIPHGLTIKDNTDTTTNSPGTGTNSAGTTTNIDIHLSNGVRL